VRLLLLALLLPLTGSALPLSEALARTDLRGVVRGNGESELTFAFTNPGNVALSIEVPAGLLGAAPDGSKMLTLRQARLELPPGQAGELAVPAISVSMRRAKAEQPYTIEQTTVPALQPLLDYSAAHDDLPRTTAQLIALLMLEEMTFTHWREYLGHEPSPLDVVSAVDALTITRQLKPAQKLPLVEDAEFRLRALRQPFARAKALQLFEMNSPEGVPVPDVSQLLHTKPGDNCPVCRMRSQMEKSKSEL
jgi:hypothetical protein